jgi:hypothetical protein
VVALDEPARVVVALDEPVVVATLDCGAPVARVVLRAGRVTPDDALSSPPHDVSASNDAAAAKKMRFVRFTQATLLTAERGRRRVAETLVTQQSIDA